MSWVDRLREGLSADIDLMALIGPRERHDRGTPFDVLKWLDKNRRRGSKQEKTERARRGSKR